MSTTECHLVGHTERRRLTLISIPFSISLDWGPQSNYTYANKGPSNSEC